MKLNLKELQVKQIDDTEKIMDVSKEMGNTIYRHTTDIGELELAREIYKTGECEKTPQNIEIIRKYMEQDFFAFVKEALNKLFEK